jgi:hypothetical protein
LHYIDALQFIFLFKLGTNIIQYYLTIQSINSQLQQINGVILDSIMPITKSDVFQNQVKSVNDGFFVYLSKCQNDIRCSKAFSLVTDTNQDIITLTLTLQMLFITNMTNPRCTTDLGLNSWMLFSNIAGQVISLISTRPIAVILIARLYRCSTEDQRVLSRTLPSLVASLQQTSSASLIDPPEEYPYDGRTSLLLTIFSDLIGFTLDENFKTNSSFYNDFCIKSTSINDFYLAPVGSMPLCPETQVSKYNYSLPSAFQDVLYSKHPRYWGKFQVNPEIFRSREDGVLMLNGDLDSSTPMFSAQQTQLLFQSEHIRTKFIEMKGITHVTSLQSYTKDGGFESTTCTDQIIAQFLYKQELNLHLETIDYNCSLKQNLIGIDWFYSNSFVNETLYKWFGNSTTDYWGINMTMEVVEPTVKPPLNKSSRLYSGELFLILCVIIFPRLNV